MVEIADCIFHAISRTVISEGHMRAESSQAGMFSYRLLVALVVSTGIFNYSLVGLRKILASN